MSANSSIEWTHHTFNPWWGCTKISAGCLNCYAEGISNRFGYGTWGPEGQRGQFDGRHWDAPKRWNASARRRRVQELVFCGSMCDLFEDRQELDKLRERLWDLVDATPNLTWQLTTKRPENIEAMTPMEWFEAFPENVWVIVSVEDQQSLDKRLPILLDLPPIVCTGLSVEPLLESIDLEPLLKYPVPGHIPMNDLEWVIVGGESGRTARPCNVNWIASVVETCQDNAVPVFVKQLGSNVQLHGGPFLGTVFPLGNDALEGADDRREIGDVLAPQDVGATVDVVILHLEGPAEQIDAGEQTQHQVGDRHGWRGILQLSEKSNLDTWKAGIRASVLTPIGAKTERTAKVKSQRGLPASVRREGCASTPAGTPSPAAPPATRPCCRPWSRPGARASAGHRCCSDAAWVAVSGFFQGTADATHGQGCPSSEGLRTCGHGGQARLVAPGERAWRPRRRRRRLQGPALQPLRPRLRDPSATAQVLSIRLPRRHRCCDSAADPRPRTVTPLLHRHRGDQDRQARLGGVLWTARPRRTAPPAGLVDRRALPGRRQWGADPHGMCRLDRDSPPAGHIWDAGLPVQLRAPRRGQAAPCHCGLSQALREGQA